MLALEQHLAQPLDHQSKDDAVAKFTEAGRAINDALSSTQSRISALQARLDAIGGHGAAGIKSGVASALGSAAAAIGNARKTEVSKYLRDDYGAFALASAGYTALHTTALALDDPGTADLAQNGLTSVARSVMQFSSALPITVLGELRDEGVAVDESVVEQARSDVTRAWKDGEGAARA